MAERSNEQKNFFKNLHTDQYKWNDFFLIPLLGLLIGFAYDVGFGVEATIVAIALLIVSCIIVYLWGSKNNKKPTEIWN